jgi:addiction module HigA family antidote
MNNQRVINEGGVIGTGEGLVNQNSRDFKELQRLILKNSSELDKSESIINKLLSVRFQMENYLEETESGKLIPTGMFLEWLIEALEIKKKDFAAYIDCQESNLSAILKGRRKINTDLAIKIGEIFRINPVLWLHIQSKNELTEMTDKDKKKYKKYRLEDLLKKAS